MKFIDAILRYFRARSQAREQAALTELKARYHSFRIFLENNGKALDLIVALDGLLHRAETTEIRAAAEELCSVSNELVDGLNLLSGDRHAALYTLHGQLAMAIDQRLRALDEHPAEETLCLALDDLQTNTPLQSGAKAANLARLRRMGLPVPNGFVCTVRACKTFLGSGQLAEGIIRILREVEIERTEVTAAASQINEMIVHSPLPPELDAALRAAYLGLEQSEGHDKQEPFAVSVRSSGALEDGVEHSFAGQFTSLLNVRGPEKVLGAYRAVIASGFSARAISYRRNAGLSLVDFDLAVLVQVMATADAAGVLFTVDPSQPESGRMLISAVPGLGTLAVDGSAPVDLYRPPREQAIPDTGSPAERYLEGAEIARKTQREVPDPLGGLRLEPVPKELADGPLLSVATLQELTRIGTIIEGVEGMAQDVEWAFSEQGGLRILQARPLRLAAGKEHRLRIPSLAKPLFTGTCASSGKVAGKVRLIHSAPELQELDARFVDDLLKAPSILVLPHSIVDAARLLPHCAGALIDIGNPTDHLACVAREYAIPMITGTQVGLTTLADGQWIILDADHGLVLEAPESVQLQAIRNRREEKEKISTKILLAAAPSPSPLPPDRQALRSLIVPLNLTDAYGPTFSLRECRTIHDLVRYTHEMAVLAMFRAGDQVMEDAGGLLRPLEIGVPFSFLVIDLGGGIRKPKKPTGRGRLALRHPLAREDVLSTPLAALCDGLTTPGLSYHSAPDPSALPGIFSTTLLDARGPRPAGSFNYALAARDYLNLNARVEFHFAMVDAVCGRDTHANYIRFRFKGGGAGVERSHRRAIFLQHVLAQNAFYTTVTGDLVTASLTGASKENLQQQLVMIGRLLGFSRFLDGIMTTDATPVELAKAFLAGRYDSRTALEETDREQG